MAPTPRNERVALITGGSGGIGRVLARRYAHDGVAVALVARREEELRQTARLVTDEGGTAASDAASAITGQDIFVTGGQRG